MKKLNINDVIIKPIITEKTSNQALNNVYTFEINPIANKDDVKRSIETIFAKSNAQVKKVRVSKKGKRSKRMGKYDGFTKSIKKAIVYLKEGSIPIYGAEGVEKEKDNKKRKGLKIIDTEKIMSEAEEKGKK